MPITTEHNESTNLRDLNDRQERFCIQYVLNGGNAAKAARDAGYSEDSDEQMGYENLTKPYIAKRIEELRKEIGQEDFGVTAEWIIARLKAVVERCMQLEKAKVNITINGEIISEEGIFEFNATGAAKALDQLAKIKQLYADRPLSQLKPELTYEQQESEFNKLTEELRNGVLSEKKI